MATTTINDRFNLLIEALKMNTSSFARSLGKSYTSVENTCKGKTRPSYDMLEAVFQVYPDVNSEWLLIGKGEMFRRDEPKSESYLLDYLKGLEQKFTTLSEQLHVKDRQIEGLQEMLKLTLGKFEGVHHSQAAPNNVRKHPSSRKPEKVRVSAVKDEAQPQAA